MHVALILPSLAGAGAQRVFVDLAHGLLERAVDVDVVIVRDEGPLRRSVPAGARLRILGGRDVSLAIPRLARYLSARRPDVAVPAITHMNLCALLAARLARPPVPVVLVQSNHLTASARHAELRRDRLGPSLARVAYRWADGVVAVSHGVADDLASVTGVARPRIEVLYNPVHFERIARAAAEPADHPWLRDKSGPVVVGAGRLAAQKDFATLIRAVRLLPDDVRLVILGDGKLRADLERLAAGLGITHRVDLCGFTPNPYPSLRAGDVFALSSRWEGLPTVLIEALSLGTPVVSTDCDSGPAEILDGGRWGALVPPGDAEALAGAIARTLAGPAPTVDASAFARFAVDAAVDRYMDVLSAAAERRRRQPDRSYAVP